MAVRLLVCILLIRTIAQACSCLIGTLCERVEQYPVIFLGEVVEGGLSPGQDPWYGTAKFARLRVKELYKGLPADTREVQVRLSFGFGMCAPMPYRLGEQTVVFVRKEADGSLVDGACTASFFVKGQEAGLDYVKRYFSGKTTATVFGRVTSSRGSGHPIEQAQVVVRNSHQEFSIYSGKDGLFEISNLPEGLLQIRAAADGYIERDPKPPFSVSRRGCREVKLELSPMNRIEGTVLDPDHQPIAGVDVFLRDPKRSQTYGVQAKTDRLGRFRFEQMDPAEYQLILSPDGVEPKSPIERTVYSKPIIVSPSSEIADISFLVPYRQRTRNVRVHLTWPDGQPAENQSITCPEVDPKSSLPAWKVPASTTDQTGAATCLTLVERLYRVSWTAAGWVPPHKSLQPVDAPIPQGRDDIDLHFQLSLADFEASKRTRN